MRVSDIVSAFQIKDGSVNTVDKDRENLNHILHRLIFNHTPEMNHGAEGHLCLNSDGSNVTEEDFVARLHSLNPGESLVVVWSYFRNYDMSPSSGYASARKAREAVTKAFQQECERLPLGHHKLKTVAKAVKLAFEEEDSSYDADLTITITRNS